MQDTELLALEARVIWGPEQAAEVDPWPDLIISHGHDGQQVLAGPHTPASLVRRARRFAEVDRTPMVPGTPPQGLAECRALLADSGRVEVTDGPSFLVERAPVAPGGTSAEIHRSDQPFRAAVCAGLGEQAPVAPTPDHRRNAREANDQKANDQQRNDQQWGDLLASERGPWAIAVEEAQVVAVCHTARLLEGAAEAGVWTRADRRRQGLATAVTAAWCEVVLAAGLIGFYSTSTGNHASRAVARRLRLRPIGHLWKLRVISD